jgi:hypothetical protein
MDKKTKQMLVIGGVLAAVGGVYLYNKNNTAAPATGSPPGGSTNPVATPGMLNAPVQQAAPPTISLGGNPSQLQTVTAWVASDGNPPPMLAMLQAADPAEIAGMNDIITMNLWGDSTTITPNLPQGAVTFWNTLINKYDPQHKYM